MTKREFGNIIREARIKKGFLLREMALGAMRHSHIEAGDFEMILNHERKALCNQLSLDRKEIDNFASQLDFSEKVNHVPDGVERVPYIACTKESIEGWEY